MSFIWSTSENNPHVSNIMKSLNHSIESQFELNKMGNRRVLLDHCKRLITYLCSKFSVPQPAQMYDLQDMLKEEKVWHFHFHQLFELVIFLSIKIYMGHATSETQLQNVVYRHWARRAQNQPQKLQHRSACAASMLT